MIDLFDMDDNKKEEDIEQQELETLEVEDESPEEFPFEENIITQEDCASDAVCLEDDDFLTRRISEMDDENKEKEINCNFSYLQEEDNSRSEGFNFDEEERKKETSAHPYQSTLEALNLNELDRITRPDVEINYDSFGDTFRRLREACGIGLEAIHDSTHIPLEYLKALEAEDFENLPKEVFIVAYIRKLGNIYHLTNDEITNLSKRLRDQIDLELPEENDEKIIMDKEQSEENLLKVKKIITWFCVIVVAIVLLITGLILTLKQKYTASNHKSSFRNETILEIQKTPKLDKYVLPMK